MKFSKKLSKVMAITAMSAMLLSITASASTVRTPNMTGVSAQYSAMVQAANGFDADMGNVVADAFTKACYTEEAINNAIANTNNAINAINNIVFYKSNNSTVSSGTENITVTSGGDVVPSYVRDNGNVSTANSYLQAAQLSGGVSFSLTSSTKGDKPDNFKAPDGYYNTVEFKTSTSLYSAGKIIDVIKADVNSKTDAVKSVSYEKNSLSNIVSKLNKYVTLLNAVKAFDSAAGCYDGSSNTTSAPSNTTNTTTAPSNTTSAPSLAGAYIDAQDVTIYVGDDFDIMDGVYAYDASGRDITDDVTTSGEVNTAKAGTYNVTYAVGNLKETITVTVLNKSADAVINASDQTVEANSEFDPMAGVTAIDDGGNGADITNLLTVTGTVNTSVPGTYKLSYCVIGENGKQVGKEVMITVEKELIHAVIEASDRTIQLGEAFDPMEGVSAYDIEGRDKDLTDQVKVDGKVNTGVTGEYELTYRVTGSSGVEVSKTVTITVIKEVKDAVIMAYDRTVGCNSDFDPMKDIKALDNNGAGKIITGDVEVDGYVDTKVEADYLLTYSVIGSNGIKVTKDVTITVSCDVDNCGVNTTTEDTTEEWIDTTEDTTEEWIDTTEDTTEEWIDTTEDTTEEWIDTTEDTTVEPVDTTQTPDTTCVVDPVCVVPVVFPIGWIVPLGSVDTTCEVVAPVDTTCVQVVDTTCAPVIDTTCWIVDTAAPVAPVDTTCWIVDTTVAPVDTTCWIVDTTVAPVDTTCWIVDTTVAPVDTTCWIVDTTAAPVDTTCVVVAPVDTTEEPAIDTTCWIVEPVDTTVVLPVDTSEEPAVDTTCWIVEPVDTTCAPVEEPDTTCWIVDDPEPVDTTCDVIAPVDPEPDTTCAPVDPEPVNTTCAPVDPGPVDDTDDPNTTCWEIEPEDPGPVDDTDDPNTTCWEIEPEDPDPVDDTDDPNTTCWVVEPEDPGPVDTTEEPVIVLPVDTTEEPTINTTCAPVEPEDTTEGPAEDTTEAPVEPVDTTEGPAVDTTCAPVGPVDTTEGPAVDTTEAPVGPVDTTEGPAVDTTCAPVGPVDTTEGPAVDTTEAPVGPVDTTEGPAVDTTCAPVGPVDTTEAPTINTTCWEVEPEDTTCEPIKIVVDPIKVEIIKTETVDTTCAPVGPIEPADTTEDPFVNTTEEVEEVVKVPENTMKPTGANFAELVFSTLTLVGTAIFARKRR